MEKNPCNFSKWGEVIKILGTGFSGDTRLVYDKKKRKKICS